MSKTGATIQLVSRHQVNAECAPAVAAGAACSPEAMSSTACPPTVTGRAECAPAAVALMAYCAPAR